MPKGRKVSQSDVLLDVPVKKREELGGRVLVYTLKEPNKGQFLYAGENPISPVLSSLKDEYDQHVKKCRILVSNTLYDAMKPKLGYFQKEVREFLADMYSIN